MGRGAINSTSRSSPSDGHTRSQQGAAAAAIPMADGDRAAQNKAGRSRREVIPLRERCWVSVEEASQVAGEGRTKVYELIALGKLLTKKTGRRRLINVQSLLEYCGE
jgi:excisionase family DNA binding protein